jgi:hypothetical protein
MKEYPTAANKEMMQNHSAAATAVFETYELVENIFLYLAAPDILLVCDVNQNTRKVVEDSKGIQKCLCYGRYDSLSLKEHKKGSGFVFFDFRTATPSSGSTIRSQISVILPRYKNHETCVIVNQRSNEDWKVKILGSLKSDLLIKRTHERRHHAFEVTFNDAKLGIRHSGYVSTRQSAMLEYLRATRMPGEELARWNEWHKHKTKELKQAKKRVDDIFRKMVALGAWHDADARWREALHENEAMVDRLEQEVGGWKAT